MAKTKTAQAKVPAEGVSLKRRRRPSNSPRRLATRWTPEQAREMGKRGGRPPGSTTAPILTVSAFMLSVFRDPEFQADFRWRAQNGLLNSSEIQNMCYFAEGRPTYKVEVTKPVDPNDEAERDALRRMPLAERRIMTDMIRKFNALKAEQPLALPATQPVAEDAEIIAP